MKFEIGGAMEKWNAYTADGTLTDIILIRDEEIPDGLFHVVCEVLVRHTDGSILCMKRAETKRAWPGYYEATAGGSALLGEDIHHCVRRELFEETGIRCEEFDEVGCDFNSKFHTIFYSFVCIVDCPKDSIVLQEGETESYMWLTAEEFTRFIQTDAVIDLQIKRFSSYLTEQNLLPHA